MKKPKFLIDAENMVKEIWNILRDKQFVRFTLSVKIYRDNLSEPKTISMQGERAPDGGWITWFPRDQNPETLQSRETLKGKLASIEEHVREYIVANALDAEWKKYRAQVEEALKGGQSPDDLENQSELTIPAMTGYGYGAHFCAPMLATAYAINGIEALTKNDLNHASHCVDRGLHWSSSDMLIANPNDRFKERARTGGLGKDIRREPVKQKVAELLMGLAPDEGWASTPDAVEAVVNKLIDSHSSFVEKYELKTHNLPITINRWIKRNPERFVHRINSKI